MSLLLNLTACLRMIEQLGEVLIVTVRVVSTISWTFTSLVVVMTDMAV